MASTVRDDSQGAATVAAVAATSSDPSVHNICIFSLYLKLRCVKLVSSVFASFHKEVAVRFRASCSWTD